MAHPCREAVHRLDVEHPERVADVNRREPRTFRMSHKLQRFLQSREQRSREHLAIVARSDDEPIGSHCLGFALSGRERQSFLCGMLGHRTRRIRGTLMAQWIRGSAQSLSWRERLANHLHHFSQSKVGVLGELGRNFISGTYPHRFSYLLQCSALRLAALLRH